MCIIEKHIGLLSQIEALFEKIDCQSYDLLSAKRDQMILFLHHCECGIGGEIRPLCLYYRFSIHGHTF